MNRQGLDQESRHSEVIRLSAASGTLAAQKTGASPNTMKTPGTDSPDIYNIAYTGEELNPWSLKYLGIPLNYLSVGFIYAGSTKLLYPILTVKNETKSSFQNAANQLVVIFWSYKILFGLLSDCFPIVGLKRKPYIISGWILCCAVLIALASMGDGVSPVNLVLMLTLANFGYVMADVAADGFMVWMAHREPIERRGRIQTLIYICRQVGRISVLLVLTFGFSGPQVSCPGWVEGQKRCKKATFDFSLTIPQFAWILAAVNLVFIPTYFLLFEEKSVRESFTAKMTSFWYVLKKRAVWQVILYTIVSNTLFAISNPAIDNTNNLWLGLQPFQKQLMTIFEDVFFFIALNLIRSYCLHINWRSMIVAGTLLQMFFMVLYLIIVYDIWREPWFYIFTDVSTQFTYTLNFLVGVFYIVEVSEPGYEAITYSLITTSHNAVSPLGTVISNQLMAAFPLLNDPTTLKVDDSEVRGQYASLLFIVVAFNLSSLLALPLLPRQKREARELLANGETSGFWAGFTAISCAIIIIYSTILVVYNVVGDEETQLCSYLLGGSGCEGESKAPVIILLTIVFVYTYGIIFYHGYWPAIKKKFF